MTAWQYLIVALPEFPSATTARGGSESVTMLNKEAPREAVAMTALGGGSVAVLLKKPSG
jgi:hypothetical protein